MLRVQLPTLIVRDYVIIMGTSEATGVGLNLIATYRLNVFLDPFLDVGLSRPLFGLFLGTLC